ncbi:hypothetical protein ABMA28_009931 [Loxostege sticticalis]|uniref:Reverse transcriptase domain-containing protein n=1 Tax=Loxostege sticticalis TaxID=481309 RepID=A0ABD0SBW5_LOXSC
MMEQNKLSKIISYNCKNIKRSVDCVRSLCKYADVVALQEHWLLPQDLSFLAEIDQDFGYTGKSGMDPAAGLIRGRLYGGVALLWRKCAFQKVSIVSCKNERIVAIKATTSDLRDMVFMSVYMPINKSANLPLFTECLADIVALTYECSIDCTYILGDYNAHPDTLFDRELMCFCMEQQWVCADKEKLSSVPDTHTFVCSATGSKRWLDHCITSQAAWSTIKNASVLYDVFWSDHYPLMMECNLSLVRSKSTVKYDQSNSVRWGIRSPEEINKYSNCCNSQLKCVDFPIEFQNCADRMCYDVSHKNIINNLYESIVSILRQASLTSNNRVGNNNNKNNKFKSKCVMGWNKHVATAHKQARLDFQLYMLYGKPDSGPIYEKMSLSRKIFKSKLRYCQQNQKQIKMDILASHHSAKQFDKFWKSTKELGCRIELPLSVEGNSDPVGIANTFKNHFKVETSLPESVGLNAKACHVEQPIRITAKEVKLAINNMKRGKSPGHDGLSVEHLKHAGPHINRVLSMLFTFCVRHSYLPPSDISDKSNYRPISLATVIAKVLDRILDVHLSSRIQLHDSQFGFREGVSTESAILSLKYAVEYYVRRQTPVYACFLDLSKAFDLVSYDILWSKLREAGISEEIVGVFSHWYSNQSNVVK